MTAVQEKAETIKGKRLSGKVALVTGASRGIGAAIALQLAHEGAAVVVNYQRSKEQAEKIVSEIAALGARALAVQGNVSDKANAEALVKEVVGFADGKIDILINNAAIFEGAPIETASLEQYDRLFDTNVRGVVATTIAALPYLRDGGRIINISSVASHFPAPGYSLYAATKGALDSLTMVWAQELGKRQITVNAVAPGTTVTDMLNQAMPEEAKKVYAEKTALGRLGQPGDIAAVVAFLASSEGRWITGQVIDAHGGLAL